MVRHYKNEVTVFEKPLDLRLTMETFKEKISKFDNEFLYKDSRKLCTLLKWAEFINQKELVEIISVYLTVNIRVLNVNALRQFFTCEDISFDKNELDR